MTSPVRTALRWFLRVVGVALLGWVLFTQVQWQDRIVRLDGEVLSGEIVATRADAHVLTIVDREDRPIAVPVAEIAKRTYGDESVPDVSYGVRTLLRRLGASLSSVVAVLLVLTLLVVLTAVRWHVLMRAVDLVIPLRRTIRLTFIGGFFNLAVPGSTGGDVVKAWYAAKETKTGTRAVISVFVDRFVGLFGLVVLAAAVLFLADREPAYDVPRTVVLVVMTLAVAGAAVVLSRPLRRALGLSWLVRRLPFQHVFAEVRASARLYKGRVGALGVTLCISLFNHAGNATACWLLAMALGIDGVGLGTALALVPICNLLSAIPLLPGGWGVGELAFAYFFGLVGVPPTEAVGLSVVFRLATLGVNLPGGVLWIFWRGHPSTATIASEVEEAAAHVAQEPPA